jgi:hypothetical protein
MNTMKNATLPGVLRNCASFAVCLVLLLLVLAFGSPQDRHAKSWSNYYPLSINNTWKYILTDNTAKKTSQFVTWRVLNLSKSSEGIVFAVWPIPSQSDDDGMQLQMTHEGLKELGNDFYLLRFPLTKGSNWSTDRRERVFTVLSEGDPCAVGKHEFNECAVIQDDDREAKLTLTTYALGVGPVRFEYRRLDGSEAGTQAAQTMEIVSFSVKPGTPSKSASGRVEHPLTR